MKGSISNIAAIEAYAEFHRAAGKAFGDAGRPLKCEAFAEVNKKYLMREVDDKVNG
ncbi:MAG: hypothetical protein JNL51_12595 [Chitinophagaceae bacterium]|nr:hypothetical protein [Chitinophagaceae bacterium]